jgi:hypothetical protein
MKRRRLVGVGLATVVCCLAPAAVAKADLAGDVASIVEQVIEDDIATTVVPNSATHFPVTCDLFPASIYALQAKRYNGFSTIVRDDLADSTGFLVTLAIDGGDLANLPLPHQTYRAQTLTVLGALLTDNPLTKLKYTQGDVNQAVCSFNASAASQPSVSSLVMQECSTAQSSAVTEIACATGLAARDAADGNETLLPNDGQRALVAIASQIVLDDPSNTAHAHDAGEFGKVVALVQEAIGSKSPIDVSGANLSATSAKLIEALAGQISVLSSTSSASSAQLVATIVAFGAKTASLTGTLNVVKAAMLGGGAYAVITDVQARNYGAAAADSFDTLDAEICPAGSNDKTLGCDRVDKDVRAFLKAASVYAIDSASAGSVDASVSADFRAAAVDLIEDMGGAGIRRKTFASKSGRSPAWPFPDFALRASLRPGFASPAAPGTATSALMTYASMDWPNFRWKMFPQRRSESSLWLGGDISLLDVFGPFVELAARNSSLGNDGARSGDAFVLAFVVPRVEIEFGIPELTKNLVVGVGGAARFYRADQNPVSSSTAPVTASYCFIGQSDCAGGASFGASNFEGTVFVKYVP